MKTCSNYCAFALLSLGSESAAARETRGLLTVNLINVYSVASFMKNTLAILSYLIFNNILEDFFLKSENSKEQSDNKEAL